VPAAVQVVAEFIRSQDMFQFDLAANPAVAQLGAIPQHKALHTLLTIFLSGSVQVRLLRLGWRSLGRHSCLGGWLPHADEAQRHILAGTMAAVQYACKSRRSALSACAAACPAPGSSLLRPPMLRHALLLPLLPLLQEFQSFAASADGAGALAAAGISAEDALPKMRLLAFMGLAHGVTEISFDQIQVGAGASQG
jgi:hypothetical protein